MKRISLFFVLSLATNGAFADTFEDRDRAFFQDMNHVGAGAVDQSVNGRESTGMFLEIAGNGAYLNKEAHPHYYYDKWRDAIGTLTYFDAKARAGTTGAVGGEIFGGIDASVAIMPNQDMRGHWSEKNARFVLDFGKPAYLEVAGMHSRPRTKDIYFGLGAGVTNNFGYVGAVGKIGGHWIRKSDMGFDRRGNAGQFRTSLAVITEERFGDILRLKGTLEAGIIPPTFAKPTFDQEGSGYFVHAGGSAELKLGKRAYLMGEVDYDHSENKYVEKEDGEPIGPATVGAATEVTGTVGAAVVF